VNPTRRILISTFVMDELLNEYIQYEKELITSNNQVHFYDESDNRNEHEKEDYNDYVERTQQYYNSMTIHDFFTALWFTISSCYICLSEYLKYKITWSLEQMQ